MKVVAFNGSPRPAGNTSILLNLVLGELQTFGIETELIQVGAQPVKGCKACLQCGKKKNLRCEQPDNDFLNHCIAKMLQADGILIGSPTYFADLTSETKALIDCAGFVARSAGDLLKRKIGAAVVAVRRAGGIHAFDSINHFFLLSQMIVVGSSYWNIGVGRDIGDVEKDQEGLKTMKVLAENMAWTLNALAAKR